MKPLRAGLVLCCAVVIPPPNLHAQSLLVRGGTLIDGTGNVPIQNAQILIRVGVIAEITTAAANAPGAVETLDARGEFILPGLSDSHVQ